MRYIFKTVTILVLVVAIAMFLSLIPEKYTLRENIIRLHVVADSNSAQEQSVKLQVRDAVLTFLQEEVGRFTDMEKAKQYIQENLTAVERIANETLSSLGSEDTAVVALEEECFPVRRYDTFSLPSGVYESLRVIIGSGEGENWWCVLFPALCLGAVSDEFRQTASAAGFSDTLTDTLAGEDGYEFSFFLLDCLGKVENFFHLR